jgi:hypothetical protein
MEALRQQQVGCFAGVDLSVGNFFLQCPAPGPAPWIPFDRLLMQTQDCT